MRFLNQLFARLFTRQFVATETPPGTRTAVADPPPPKALKPEREPLPTYEPTHPSFPLQVPKDDPLWQQAEEARQRAWSLGVDRPVIQLFETGGCRIQLTRLRDGCNRLSDEREVAAA